MEHLVGAETCAHCDRDVEMEIRVIVADGENLELPVCMVHGKEYIEKDNE